MTADRMIVWRHGRTEWNANGRFQGQTDIPLDEVGRHQAATIASILAAKSPAAIFSSDLSRAQQTAAPLAEATGLEVQLDKRLREISYGSWEGLRIDEIATTDPELAERYFAGEEVRRSATGETRAEVAARAAEALEEIGRSAADGSTVVVVMHGSAAKIGTCNLVGLGPEHWDVLGALHNCGWITVERHRRGGYWRIEEYNVQGAIEPRDPISR